MYFSLPACASEHMHVHQKCAGVYTGQDKTSDALELQLQMVVKQPGRLLGIKPRSSTREASALNHCAISAGDILLKFTLTLIF